MTLSLPRFQASAPLVDEGGNPSQAFHIWWDTFASNLETNFNNLSNTVQQLSDLNSDNVLTPAKKPIWIMLYGNITAEQADLDAKATSYGITTEKTNYDSAVSTLSTYLAGLTSAVLWNNLTGNTTIVGTTFRTNFNNVFSTKQLLLDKMHSAAQSLANTAQTTANTGVSNAAAAQSTANTAVTNAASAQSTADTVKRDDSISTSWMSPGTAISASDAGSDATITITNNTRHYSNNTNASVTGSTITGLAYSTTYYVYYDDASKAGGAVTYHATTNPNTALPGAAVGRHYVGIVTTPAAGGGTTTGTGSSGGGGGSFGGGNIT